MHFVQVGKYTYTLQTSNSGAVSVSLSGKTGGGEAVMLQASVSTDDLDLGKGKLINRESPFEFFLFSKTVDKNYVDFKIIYVHVLLITFGKSRF